MRGNRNHASIDRADVSIASHGRHIINGTRAGKAL